MDGRRAGAGGWVAIETGRPPGGSPAVEMGRGFAKGDSSRVESCADRVKCPLLSLRGEKFLLEEKMTEGGRREGKWQGGSVIVARIKGFARVRSFLEFLLPSFLPSCSCSQLAKSIPMAAGRVTVAALSLSHDQS